jgi:hypothetical protein
LIVAPTFTSALPPQLSGAPDVVLPDPVPLSPFGPISGVIPTTTRGMPGCGVIVGFGVAVVFGFEVEVAREVADGKGVKVGVGDGVNVGGATVGVRVGIGDGVDVGGGTVGVNVGVGVSVSKAATTWPRWT